MSFVGKSIPEQAFRDDDGSVVPAVAAALDRASNGRQVDVVAALRGTRLLVPLVAVLDSVEEATDATGGSAVEKDSHLAAPFLTGRDGSRASLAFTSVKSATTWQIDARLVPSSAEEVAAAALGDGSAALILDVADGHALTLGVAALHSLAGVLAPLPDIGAFVESIVADTALTVEEAPNWEMFAGLDGVPVLVVDFFGPDPAGQLAQLADRFAQIPEVAGACPVGLDFALPSA